MSAGFGRLVIDGPRYRIDRRERLQYRYEFRTTGARFAGGADPMLVNAVFGLIGEL